MGTSFKQNMDILLKGKQNWDYWFARLRYAADFEDLWVDHLDRDPEVTYTVGAGATATQVTPKPKDAAELKVWEIKDRKIRSGILLSIHCSLYALISDSQHTTAWKVLQVLKDAFDTKTDLEFVHLVMKMNQMKMSNGRSLEYINQLKPINEIIETHFKDASIAMAFLIQASLNLPNYKSLLTTLSASDSLKTMSFNELCDRYISLDKTFNTQFPSPSPAVQAFEVEDDVEEEAYVSRSSFRGRGRGGRFSGRDSRGRGGRGRGKPRQHTDSPRSIQKEQKPEQSKVTCYKCGQPGHYANRCRMKTTKSNQGNCVEDSHFACSFVDADVVSGKYIVAHAGFADIVEQAPPVGVANAATVSSDEWIMDTGATQHMTSRKDFFVSLSKNIIGEVHMADSSVQKIEGAGSVMLKLKDSLPNFQLLDVLYIPGLRQNLLSLSQLLRKGFDLRGSAATQMISVVFPPTGEVVLTGKLDGKLIKLNGFADTKLKQIVGFTAISHLDRIMACTASFASLSKEALWHARMGHISMERIRDLDGLPPSLSHKPIKCEACIMAKSTRLPFGHSERRSTRVLELVHSDICGPMPINSLKGNRYYITFIDDYSRKVWIQFIKQKSEAFYIFCEWKKFAENQCGQRLKTFRSDNGGEYRSNEFEHFLSSHGIRHQLTVPGTPQQNGVAERMNRTLMNSARAMLLYKKLPAYLWEEAVSSASQILNVVPPADRKGKSPNEMWTGHPPNVGHFRIFGSFCYAHVLPEDRNKLQARAVKGIFVGYPIERKGYKVFLPDERRVIISRDVVFAETEDEVLTLDARRSKVPAMKNADSQIYDIDIPELAGGDSEELFKILEYNGDDPQQSSAEDSSSPPLYGFSRLANSPVPDPSATAPPIVAPASSSGGGQQVQGESSSGTSADDGDDEGFETGVPPVSMTGRGSREARQLLKEIRSDETGKTGTRSAYRARQEQRRDGEDQEEVHLVLRNEPQNFQEAVTQPEWRTAMQKEMESHYQNGTWELTDLPRGRKVVQCKWVYKSKLKPDGTLDKHKARLVAKGFTQKKGVDYSEVFSPTAKWPTIRALIALAAQEGWKLHQLDVKTAFLNGELEEEIYMAQPEGFEEAGSQQKVCRLKKSIYGLKQAPRAWYTKLSNRMKQLGFEMCDYQDIDATLFYKKIRGTVTYLLVFVDDMILTGNSDIFIDTVKKDLGKSFEISDLGLLTYYLGVEVKQEENQVSMCQQKYIGDILERFGFQNCKAMNTPMEANLKLQADDGSSEVDGTLYRQLVGSLIYVTNTRPDISYAVSILSKFMTHPRETHWHAAVRVLRYLKGTQNLALVYRRSKDFRLEAYSDADFGSDVDTRRSITGYLTSLGTSIISWRSKQQRIVTDSTAEAEYVAASETCKEIEWMRKLLDTLGYTQKGSTVLHVDNQSAIHIAKNPVHHDRTKHISTKVHRIRELLYRGVISLDYCPTASQKADIFTKALQRVKFEQF